MERNAENARKLLLERLERLAQQSGAAGGPDPAKAREEWLAQLAVLHERIRTWVAPMVEKKLLTLDQSEVDVSEHRLGTYSAPALRITFPDGRSAMVLPRGRDVVGARGRVDVLSGANKALLVQLEPGKWAIVRRSPGHMEKDDLEEGSFLTLLQELVDL